MGVNQFLSARYLRQVQSGLSCHVQAADVGYQNRRIQLALANHGQTLLHIVCIAAGGSYYMGSCVMDVVEVERR